MLLGLAIGQAEWETAAYYLFPISAYMAGAFISELLPNPVKYHLKIRWDTLLIAVEMATVLVLGLVPESAPVQISQVAVNFIASMQYNTFRQAEGTPMATTFATNHIRQVGVGLAKEIQHFRKKIKTSRKMGQTLHDGGIFLIRCGVWNGCLQYLFREGNLDHSAAVSDRSD